MCPLRRGDCIVLDYRTLHAGLPNRSNRARPIVYMVYARPWFFDHANHVNRRRIPVDMPLERYDELPASVRPIGKPSLIQRNHGVSNGLGKSRRPAVPYPTTVFISTRLCTRSGCRTA